jgi:predicted nucleotidyltransferase
MLTPEAQIKITLDDIEAAMGVRILYAAESGSRAWKIESPDSDYDVRFIYAHPAERYLLMSKPVTTYQEIKYPFDYAGWDVFKACELARKSNMLLIEWLHDDIRYRPEHPFITGLREKVQEFYSARALVCTYTALAMNNRAKYKINRCIPIKEYAYIIRPLLAATWMVNHDWKIPPIDMPHLLEEVALSDDVRNEIKIWMNQKRLNPEKVEIIPFPAIEDWAGYRIEQLKLAERDAPTREFPEEALNALLRRVVTCR